MNSQAHEFVEYTLNEESRRCIQSASQFECDGSKKFMFVFDKANKDAFFNELKNYAYKKAQTTTMAASMCMPSRLEKHVRKILPNMRDACSFPKG